MTPSAFARRLGGGVHKVLGWIERGELGALNVATNPSGAKRWRILLEQIARFEAIRSAIPRPALTRRRRKKMPKGFVEYY